MKSLSKIVGIGLLSLTSSYAIHPQYIEPEKDRPLEYHDSLSVNILNKNRRVVKKSEEEGIKDMKRLVKESPLEEAWAYLPDKKEWHEVGRNEDITFQNNHSYIDHTTFDISYIRTLMSENKEIFLYHFHPNHETIFKYSPEFRKRFPNDSIHMAIPSYRDIYSVGFFAKEFNDINKGTLIGKICSDLGVTEYKIHGKNEIGKMLCVAKEFALSANFVLLQEEFVSDDKTERIRKIMESINNEDKDVGINFKPYEESLKSP